MTPNGENQLKIDEGFRPTEYTDTRCFATIGYGTRIKTGSFPRGISEDTANVLMNNALSDNRKRLWAFEWFRDLSPARQDIIENMAYNLGISGLLTFKNMIASLSDGNYGSAALDMLASEWRQQVGPRALRLAHGMAGNE